MFKILLKNKKGFTLVELIVVLLLLSVGVFAMANMMRVTYRAFQKSEERSIKQEAVKVVAEKPINFGIPPIIYLSIKFKIRQNVVKIYFEKMFSAFLIYNFSSKNVLNFCGIKVFNLFNL